MVKGDPRIFEVRGISGRNGTEPSRLRLMAASGRGFLESEICDIFLPAPEQLEKLRKETEDETKRETADRHRSSLIRIGVVPADSSLDYCIEIAPHGIRRTQCWKCHRPITNVTTIECSLCGWIICPCGACGCSHPEYAHLVKKSSTDAAGKAPVAKSVENADDIERTFPSFDSAREFMRTTGGATLRRATDGEWIVSIKR
jgi:hypothetical protein